MQACLWGSVHLLRFSRSLCGLLVSRTRGTVLSRYHADAGWDGACSVACSVASRASKAVRKDSVTFSMERSWQLSCEGRRAHSHGECAQRIRVSTGIICRLKQNVNVSTEWRLVAELLVYTNLSRQRAPLGHERPHEGRSVPRCATGQECPFE